MFAPQGPAPLSLFGRGTGSLAPETGSWCASVGCWNPITLFGKLVRNGCAAELVVIDKFGDCRVVTAHRTLLVAPQLQSAELHGQGIE